MQRRNIQVFLILMVRIKQAGRWICQPAINNNGLADPPARPLCKKGRVYGTTVMRFIGPGATGEWAVM
jgi:hypothetical protein